MQKMILKFLMLKMILTLSITRVCVSKAQRRYYYIKIILKKNSLQYYYWKLKDKVAADHFSGVLLLFHFYPKYIILNFIFLLILPFSMPTKNPDEKVFLLHEGLSFIRSIQILTRLRSFATIICLNFKLKN